MEHHCVLPWGGGALWATNSGMIKCTNKKCLDCLFDLHKFVEAFLIEQLIVPIGSLQQGNVSQLERVRFFKNDLIQHFNDLLCFLVWNNKLELMSAPSPN